MEKGAEGGGREAGKIKWEQQEGNEREGEGRESEAANEKGAAETSGRGGE